MTYKEQVVSTGKTYFTISAEILACSLANFLLSISGQTHEFIIYVMRQQMRADNLLS